jgi:hypothetical protein
VSPIVEAALIAGGVSLVSLAGTVAVAVSGFRNTRKVTSQTIQAALNGTLMGLDAAREERLWERKSAAYEVILSGLMDRAAWRRSHRPERWMDQALKFLEEFLRGGYTPAEWNETQSRLFAYAPDDAMTAYIAIRRADVDIAECWRAWAKLSGEPEDGSLPSAEATAAALNQAVSTMDACDERDNELAKILRADLRHKPSESLALPKPPDPPRPPQPPYGLMGPPDPGLA